MLPVSSGVAIATAVYRRLADSPVSLSKRHTNTTQDQLPPWSLLIVLIDWIIFLPLLIITFYTFQRVFPVLAMVEDENDSAYDRVSLDDDETASFADDAAFHNGPKKVPDAPGAPAGHASASRAPAVHTPAGRTLPITSSIRATTRLVRSNGGFGAFFRGFACYFAYTLLTSIILVIFMLVLPTSLAFLALLPASLALVQLDTAWLHIVMTPRSPIRFWSRAPAFRRTLEATARPVALLWLVTQIARFTPSLVAWAINANDNNWKDVVVVLASLAVVVLLVIPAHVVLVRVQASLLPEADDTIIPFDRSFGGAVVPAVLGGKGYVSMTEAWNTFSAAAWRRLVQLYVKVFLVGIAAILIMAAVIIPEYMLLHAQSTRKQ
ncbi:hypothetical protein HYQ45_011282 [Verticillium longisporum]|uniref:Ubiquitin carrier protein n=1 Tax=Verticillium longisporum TaxID=100787 RepID=A0A0G4LTE2_VERLO|nr:hypothetical protein HYQ44_008159 [Verticillium longisporum]KAG7129690.1 hypothetical protein HYQ45_011282 [Verticillium longisporum]CRK25323.1 hypothetical protein BN1723_003232 [Verticillium longisporum]CRK33426.1 hypothetical protein BN1708_001104 [Verticillium longisporum]